MNILIAYASYNNTTGECAQLLADKLPGSHVVNLSKSNVDISNYDIVIIGSCVRFNSIHKSAVNFIEDNLDALMKKNTAIYLCCAFTEKINQYLIHNFPKKLLNKSVSLQCFGGRLKVKPYRLHDNYIIKLVRKNFRSENINFPEINYESIQNMADNILEIK